MPVTTCSLSMLLPHNVPGCHSSVSWQELAEYRSLYRSKVCFHCCAASGFLRVTVVLLLCVICHNTNGIVGNPTLAGTQTKPSLSQSRL
jgi:hypothetical protein